jgi:hypothetical protein
LWDRAGSRTDGYTSPEDMAVEMFEESLEPFLQELHRLFDLKMYQEANLYCMGILKGIYQPFAHGAAISCGEQGLCIWPIPVVHRRPVKRGDKRIVLEGDTGTCITKYLKCC